MIVSVLPLPLKLLPKAACQESVEDIPSRNNCVAGNLFGSRGVCLCGVSTMIVGSRSNLTIAPPNFHHHSRLGLSNFTSRETLQRDANVKCCLLILSISRMNPCTLTKSRRSLLMSMCELEGRKESVETRVKKERMWKRPINLAGM